MVVQVLCQFVQVMGAVCQSNFVTGRDLGMLGESESQVHFGMSNQYHILSFVLGLRPNIKIVMRNKFLKLNLKEIILNVLRTGFFVYKLLDRLKIFLDKSRQL